jgi:hypothetical protein
VKSAAGNKTRREKAVPLSRLTVKGRPWHEVHLLNEVNEKRQSKRQYEEPMTTATARTTPVGTKPESLKKILSMIACQSGKSKGWRARGAGFVGPARRQLRQTNFQEWFRRGLAELNGFLSAVPQTRMHSERDIKDRKWKVRKQKYNPFIVKYL